MTPADTVRATSHSEQETLELGERLGRLLEPGDLLLARGEIGAGKTTLAKGIALGLEIPETVVSPTFMLHCLYEGRLTLNHFDFYRLEDPSEVLILGLEEALDAGGVAVVEWPERVPAALRPPYLEVELAFGAAGDERALRLTAVGAGWTARIASVLP